MVVTSRQSVTLSWFGTHSLCSFGLARSFEPLNMVDAQYVPILSASGWINTPHCHRWLIDLLWQDVVTIYGICHWHDITSKEGLYSNCRKEILLFFVICIFVCVFIIQRSAWLSRWHNMPGFWAGVIRVHQLCHITHGERYTYNHLHTCICAYSLINVCHTETTCFT